MIQKSSSHSVLIFICTLMYVPIFVNLYDSSLCLRPGFYWIRVYRSTVFSVACLKMFLSQPFHHLAIVSKARNQFSITFLIAFFCASIGICIDDVFVLLPLFLYGKFKNPTG